MNKLNLLWILVFLMPLINAYNIDTIYQPNLTYYNFTTIVNIPKNFSILLNNSGNSTIYNISANEMYPYNFSQITNLTPGQIGELKFRITTKEVFGFSPFYPTIYYSFPETRMELSKTVNVILNSSSFLFNPRNITINQNDTICWDNQDSSSHWIKETGSSPKFSSNLSVNQQFCFLFTQAYGYIEYYDEATGKNAHIVVEPQLKNILIHDPLLDKSVNIILKSEYPLAQVLVENYINNFTISYNGVAEGVFRVMNVYNETIHYMNFEISKPIDSEISFSESGFDLPVNASKIINYRIKPKITKTAETDKNYNFNLIIKGDNIIANSYPLNVYIIKRDFEMNESECFDWFAFCKQYPTSTTCTGFKPIIQIENQTIFLDKEWQYNLSERELRDLIHREAEGISAFGRIENRLKDTDAIIYNQTEMFTKSLILFNETNYECNNYKERYDKRIRMEWILFIIFAIVGLLSLAGYGGWKIYKAWDKKVRGSGEIKDYRGRN